MRKFVLAVFTMTYMPWLCFSQYEAWEFWNKHGELIVDWHTLGESQKTFVLEKHRDEINYAVANLGKQFNNIDVSRIGNTRGYLEFNKIGTGLIALKYLEDYHNPIRAIPYFEMSWDSYKKCKKENQNSSCDWPFNDASPLDFVIGVSIDVGMYKNALEFYPEAYKEMLKRLSIGTDVKLLKSNFSKYQKNWPNEADEYQTFIRNWEKDKKLAKTTKPKPLEPAVQHHEWFYGDKQEEVLKALEYYHKFNVRFMLEKALKHKDPVIAAKAKEYLDNPVKEGAGNDKKK